MSDWEARWQAGVSPGDKWDALRTEPMLQSKLDSGYFQPLLDRCEAEGRKAKALVPGCGRGYPIVSLALAGFQVTGMDISETALLEAKKYISSQQDALDAAGITEDDISLQAVDFFSAPTESKYDLIFDSTFLCAFEPELREAWASQQSKFLSPGGQIVLNLFPLPGKDRKEPLEEFDEVGPPFTLSSGLVNHLLTKSLSDDLKLCLVLEEAVPEDQLARVLESAVEAEIIAIYQKPM